MCTFSVVLNTSTNLLWTSSLRLSMTEISVKRPLLVELLSCSHENTWHITQRCQLIDGLPLTCYFKRIWKIRHILKRTLISTKKVIYFMVHVTVELVWFNVNTNTIFAHNVDFINSSHRSNRVIRANVQSDSGWIVYGTHFGRWWAINSGTQ